MSESHSPIHCPKCNRIDKVQKVTAIVQESTHQISGQVPVSHTYQDSEGLHSSTSYESYNAVQQSVLASKLAPPQKPRKRENQFGIIFSLAEAFLVVLGLFAIEQMANPEYSLSATPTSAIQIWTGFALLLISIAVFIGVRKIHVLTNEPVNKRTAADLAEWERSLNKWQELYYCSRDDCLFFPEGEKAFNISDLYNAIDWHPPKG